MQHKQGSAEQENVTAIVIICADGTVLQPTIIFKVPHILTSNQFFAKVFKLKQGWEEEAVAKVTRAVEQENKKVLKATADITWKSQLEVHKLTVTAWEVKCVVLQGNEMKVRDLPKKPKRPVNPKATVKVESEPSSSDGKLE